MGEFPRLNQTFARIGAGLTVFASLVWLLWDGVTSELDPEPSVAFLVSLFVWVASEFKKSDEIVFRASSANDIRVSKLMLGYSSFQLREMLKYHDFYSGIEKKYYSEFRALNYDCDMRIIKFQKRRLVQPFDDFRYQLDKLIGLMETNTAPGRLRTDIRYVIDPSLHSKPWSRELLAEVKEMNEQAKVCWEVMMRLVKVIHDEVPEAFDEEILCNWRYI